MLSKRRTLTLATALIFGFGQGLLAQPGDEALTSDQRESLENAVEKGFAWLAGQQRRDGSFPTLPQGQPGVTSLCVMAFMSHGYLPDNGEYGPILRRLLSTQCVVKNRMV